jgi:hypothetical protein
MLLCAVEAQRFKQKNGIVASLTFFSLLLNGTSLTYSTLFVCVLQNGPLQVLAKLTVNRDGLSAEDVKERQEKYGKNGASP